MRLGRCTGSYSRAPAELCGSRRDRARAIFGFDGEFGGVLLRAGLGADETTTGNSGDISVIESLSPSAGVDGVSENTEGWEGSRSGGA